MTAVARAVIIGGRLVPQATSTYQVKKHYHGKDTTLANYKRGTGGRSSFSGVVATVFGSSGSYGPHLVNKIAKHGGQVIIPYRSEPYHLKELKLYGDLGQIIFVPFDIRDEDSIRKAMRYSNTVINLVGRNYETKNFTFRDVHVDGAQRIARIAKELKVPKLIHFSAMNASPTPPQIFLPNGSEFLRSKFEGENVVREAFPEAVIMRPADIFSPSDRIMSYFVSRARRVYGFGDYLPLWKTGTETTKIPVFHEDVSNAVMKVLDLPWTDGETFELYGPVRMFLDDLINYLLYLTNQEKNIKLRSLNTIDRLQLRIGAMLRNPFFAAVYSDDILERECMSDTPTGCLSLKDLGITKPTKIEDVYYNYARRGFMKNIEASPYPAALWRDLPPNIKPAEFASS